jgi:hypothetical protein
MVHNHMYYSPGKSGAMGKVAISKWQETSRYQWLNLIPL